MFRGASQQRGRGQGHGSSTFGFSGKSTAYTCNSCDRSFRGQSDLDAHMAEHEKCPWIGCHLVAHPKIIEKHISMQHLTGLADRIPTLNTPEEIAKWREDRRKNFPTKGNVEKKATERAERNALGVLEAPKMRFAKPRMPFLAQRGRGRGGHDRGRGRGHHGYGFGEGRGRGDQWRGRGQFRGRGGRGRWRDDDWGSRGFSVGPQKSDEPNNFFFGEYDGPDDDEEMGENVGGFNFGRWSGKDSSEAVQEQVSISGQVEQLADKMKDCSTNGEAVFNRGHRRVQFRRPFGENRPFKKKLEGDADDDEEARDVPMFGGTKDLTRRRRGMRRTLYDVFGDLITDEERVAKKERKARRRARRELRAERRQKEMEVFSDSDEETNMEVDIEQPILESVEEPEPQPQEPVISSGAAALSALLGAYGSSSDEEGEIKADPEPKTETQGKVDPEPEPETQEKEEPKSEPEEGEITDDDDEVAPTAEAPKEAVVEEPEEGEITDDDEEVETTVQPLNETTLEKAMDVSVLEVREDKEEPASGETKKKRRQKKRGKKRSSADKEKNDGDVAVEEAVVEAKPVESERRTQFPERGKGPAQQPPFRRFVAPIRKSLLEKLLANDILHERSVIFQCLKYVVANNFFDEEKPPEEASESQSALDK